MLAKHGQICDKRRNEIKMVENLFFHQLVSSVNGMTESHFNNFFGVANGSIIFLRNNRINFNPWNKIIFNSMCNEYYDVYF